MSARRTTTTQTKSDVAPARQRRTGGRSQRVWEAVSGAVVALLMEGGYDAVTMVEVARRAGVNPTSLYRRWQTREALLLEVLSARAEVALSVPDTGSLRGDLTAFLTTAATFLQTPYGVALLQLAVSAMSRPDAVPYRTQYLRGRLPAVATMIERARERGEIDTAIALDATELIELLAGPLYVRLIFTARRIDAALIAKSVDQVCLRLMQPAPARSARRSTTTVRHR